MGVKAAGGVAGLLSGTTLLACLVAVPYLISEIGELRRMLDADMAEFRILSNDAWQSMIRMGGSPRARRQAEDFYAQPPPPPPPASYPGGQQPAPAPPGPSAPVIDFSGTVRPPLPPTDQRLPPPQCQCDERPNDCPAGPPGVKGPVGTPGPDGLPGQDGKDGKDGEEVVPDPTFPGCTTCPNGPPGPPGTAGRSGPRGMRGAAGQRGQNGRNGNPGSPGSMGDTGPAGPPGNAGTAGVLGDPATQVVGRPGKKGPAGPEGPEGEPGRDGNPATDGAPGKAGPVGPLGEAGSPGAPGDSGTPGFDGEAGEDSQYCPCPNRGGDAPAFVAPPGVAPTFCVRYPVVRSMAWRRSTAGAGGLHKGFEVIGIYAPPTAVSNHCELTTGFYRLCHQARKT